MPVLPSERLKPVSFYSFLYFVLPAMSFRQRVTCGQLMFPILRQRLGKAAKGLDDNNNHVCPKLGSLRWCLGHEMLIREFPWNRQLWGQEQEGQRSGCEGTREVGEVGLWETQDGIPEG